MPDIIANPSGIASTLAIGTPTLGKAVRVGGIASTLRMGAPAVYLVDPNKPYVWLIGGVDRTRQISIAGAEISKQLNSPDTLRFVSISADGTYRPTTRQEIIVIEAATGSRLFGGDIIATEEDHEDGTDLIRVRCECVGYAGRLDRRVISAYYEPDAIAWTPAFLILDLLRNEVPELGILSAGGSGGQATVEEFIFQHVSGTQAVRQVLDADGIDYWVTEDKVFYTTDTTGWGSAPFNIADGDGNWDSNSMRVRRETGRYANRVGIRSDLREPASWTDERTGADGFGVGFFLTKYRLQGDPIVKVNGTIKTVGAYASSHGAEFTYVPNGYGVQANITINTNDEVTITYPIPLQPIYWVQDDTEIATYGKYETVIDIKDVYDRARWQEIGEGVLARLKQQPYVVDYVTQRNGLKPGMTQVVNTTKPYVPNQTLLIDSVSGSFQPTGSGGFWSWRVRASSAQVQGERSYERTMGKIKQMLAQPQDRHRTTFRFAIARTVEGVTNPGMTVATVNGSHEVDKPGFLKEVRLRFDTVPTTDTVQIDVLVNGSTVFANSTYIEFGPNDTGTVVKRDFTAVPLAVSDGDIITAEIITADAAAKDGMLEVEVQG